MRVLALDQASRTSGWAVFNDGKLVTFGKFTADHSDVGDRLHFIRSKVNSLIDEYDIDEVVFEDIQLQGKDIQNVKVYRALAEVRGVLEEYFTRNKIKY
jgi:Holliday junction resolvasome RuvABC endonuclease subunit